MSNWAFLEAFICRQSRYDNCKSSLLTEISSPGVSLYRYLLTAFQLMLLLKRTKTAFPLKYFIIGHLLVPASPSLPPPLVSYPEQSPACPQTLQFLLFILETLSSPPVFVGAILCHKSGAEHILMENSSKKKSPLSPYMTFLGLMSTTVGNYNGALWSEYLSLASRPWVSTETRFLLFCSMVCAHIIY